jgi:hypothetical protein
MIAAYREILLADPTVAAAVGQRIYPGIKPLDQRQPSIVLRQISDVPDYHFNGPSGFSDGTIQVDCWGPDYASAKSLADAAQTVLENYSGTPAAGEPVGWIEISNRFDIEPVIEPGKNEPSERGIQFDAEFLRI